MTPSELETWSRKIVAAALDGSSVEDSRIELKANWIPPEKAADRLAGHANASRGEDILWIFGIDENNRKLVSVDPAEKGDWYRSVERRFDGFAPRLLLDVNFEVGESQLTCLLFDTSHEAPFVVKNPSGGYPEFIVPWRTGTAKRAADRTQLLSLLVPKRTLAELRRETEFNKTVASGSSGGVFRTEHFSRALASGVLNDIPPEIREQVLSAYSKIDLCNHKTIGYHQFSGNWNARVFLGQEIVQTFKETGDVVQSLSEVLNAIHE